MTFPSSADHVCRFDPSDVPLTALQARMIAAALDNWPPGLGYVLLRDPSRKRGWRTHPHFDKFHRKPVPRPSDDVKHCPVVMLTEQRDQHNFGAHLSAWRSLRDATALALGLDVHDPDELHRAHLAYNDALRTDPSLLAAHLRTYADLNSHQAGTVTTEEI